MLKLEWVAADNPGCPEDPAFANVTDRLLLRGDAGSQELQQFRRVDAGVAAPAPALAAAIDQWLAKVAGRRIVVMAHGYQFDPTDSDGADDDPFNLVYGVPRAQFGEGRQVDYHNSWLPLVGECDNFGAPSGSEIALAFAWVSEASLSQYEGAAWRNSYQYAALDLAPAAAKALATLLKYLNGQGKIIDILAHSLGTRLVSQAIGLLRAGTDDRQIRRLVLLGGAEFCPDAKADLLGRAFEVVNVGSRIDQVLKWGAEGACAPFRAMGSGAELVIGRDGLSDGGNWLDLQIDRGDAANWLKQKGYSVSGAPDNSIHPAAFLQHWVYYMNNGAPDDPGSDGGNRKLVKDLLADPGLAVAWFRQSGFPAGFTVDSYGQVDAAVPVTPASCAERRQLDNPMLAAEI